MTARPDLKNPLAPCPGRDRISWAFPSCHLILSNDRPSSYTDACCLNILLPEWPRAAGHHQQHPGRCSGIGPTDTEGQHFTQPIVDAIDTVSTIALTAMEVETDSRASFEYLSARQRQGYSGTPYQAMTASLKSGISSRGSEVPRRPPSALAVSDMLSYGNHRPIHLARDPTGVTALEASCGGSEDSVGSVSSTFRFEKWSSKLSFNLKQSAQPSPRGIKRRRQVQDVDGPNTAELCCKKRRLRADLITSRLSQPFSQPATHILNREGAETGDKRFLKMATSVDAVRRIAHLHATSFLRFSVMNRIRKRLGVMRLGIQQQQRPHLCSEPRGTQAREVEATTQAPWKPQSLQVASGASYWRPSGVGGGSNASPSDSPGLLSERPQSPKSPLPPVPRVSKPIALPMPASDLAATKERTAPRIHSVASPELRPDMGSMEEEEDSFAFLHPDFDDYGDEDPEHVYSDFGAIFRSGSPDSPAAEDHSYEEYLDELDGISWATR